MMRCALLGRCFRIPLILLTVCLWRPICAVETPTSICDRDPSAALVFVGTLMDAKPPGGYAGFNIMTFHIIELLEGETSSDVTLGMEPACYRDPALPDQIGRAFLVRTHLMSEGIIDTLMDCDQMRPVDQASTELEYFRKVKKGKTPTEISGEARFQKRLPLTSFPLPGTSVHLLGGGHEYNFVSDDRGLFRGVLDPGRYKVSVGFPKGFEPISEGLCGPLEFTLAEGRCTSVALCAQASGSITAHIVDADGDSLPSNYKFGLTLTTAERGEFVENVFPDEKSNLVIDNLLSGKYILALTAPATEEAPYRPFYYPGVRSRAEAQVIDLGPGEQKVLPEMRIKKGKPCWIRVHVIDEDQKSLPSDDVTIAYAETRWFYIAPEWRGDAHGEGAAFAVFPGTVFLRAENENEARTGFDSDVVEVNSCPSEPVLLKVGHSVTSPQKPRGN